MWNFNPKSQKRPVQLNSALLHKELIKVTSRRWTKLSSPESENLQALPQDLLQTENTEMVLWVFWKCSAPSQQLSLKPLQVDFTTEKHFS